MITYDILIADKQTAGSIRNWLNKDNIPSIVVVRRAETWLYRRLRLREMLAVAEGYVDEGANTIELPPRYLQARHLMFTGEHKQVLRRRRLEEVEAAAEYDVRGARVRGKPQFYTADATSLLLDRPADRAYPYRLRYYAEPAPLSTSNPTNVLTERAFEALFAACNAFATDWTKEFGNKPAWLAEATAEIERLNVEDDQEAGGIELETLVL